MSKRRRAVWIVIGLLVVALVAMLIPGSPVYLPDIMASGGQHDGHSTRYWTKALDDPDPETRKSACFALGAIGAEAERAVPKLAALMLEDQDPVVRAEAALALSKMDPATKAAVPQLAKALEDADPIVRMNAARALFRLKQDARPAVPAMLKAMADDENQTNVGIFTTTVYELVVLALGRATAGTDEAVPVLTDALKKAPRLEARLAAIRALGEVGPAAKSVVPILKPLLEDKDRNIKEAADEALRKIEPPVQQAAAAPGGELATTLASYDNLELPVAEREYIWEIEHRGNVLSKVGFRALAAAIKSGDSAALARLMADDFTGTDLGDPRRVRAASDFVAVERLEDSGRTPVSLSRAGFVDRLLAARREFEQKPPDVKFALITLSPKTRGDLEGLWQGSAQLRMFGEATKGAPAEVVMTLRFEIASPAEDVLRRPGWIHSAGVAQTLTGKAPRYLFAEVGRERGLDSSALHDNWTSSDFHPVTGGVYVCDFDRDGWLDVLVTDVNGSTLYHGLPGGRFEDVTSAVGLAHAREPSNGPPLGAWVDLDGDGWEDLILGDRVYRNEVGQRFVDYTDRAQLTMLRDANAVIVADYDRDGKLDLYITRSGPPGRRSWLDGRTAEVQGNFLVRNLGNWQFKDVSRASGARAKFRSSFTAAWLDANNDGWPDLIVPNEFGDGVLLVNQRDGTFTERPLADRPADFGTMGLAVGDINNDGNIDIYCANMYSKAGTRVIGNLAPDAFPAPVVEKMRRFVAGSQLHLNRGGLKFDQVGSQMQVAGVGWAYGTCLADFDNDGWLDVYGTAGFISRNRDDPDG